MTWMAQAASLASLAAHGRFSGAVLVRQENETLLEGAYGVADRENGRPNTPETAFQIASISKQFCSPTTKAARMMIATSVRSVCAS
jgi:CubicO group peptidase (beta-lactamase class C family)